MKSAKEWAKGLPLANPYEAGRQLIVQIEEWNQQLGVTPRQRFAALEAIAEVLLGVLDSLDRDLVDVAFPLRTRQQKAADLGDHLRSLTIEGYELVLSAAEPPAGALGRHFATLWSQAAQRTLFYAVPLLGMRKRLNLRVTDGVWVRLHSLYRLALMHQVEGLRIALPLPRKGRKSVGQIYREGVLLALLPIHEIRRELRQEIENTLALWGEQLVVCATDHLPPHAHVDFVVDFTRDQGPIRFGGDLAECRNENWLAIDAGGLGRFLRRLTKQEGGTAELVELGQHYGQVSRRTLNALTRAYRPPAKRCEERVAVQERAEAWITFGAVHHRLPGGVQEEAIDYTLPEEQRRFLCADPDRRWGMFCLPVELLDLSTHGLRMELDGGYELSLRVGDLVGVKRKQGQEPLIGHVRWLEVLGGTRIAVGLFVWCRAPRKALLVTKAKDRSKVTLPALVCEHARSGQTLLIAPYISGIRKKRLNLLMQGKRLPLRLRGRPVEYSQVFAAYEFSIPMDWEQGKQRQLTDLSLGKLDRLLQLAN